MVEASSFQLELTDGFHPEAAAIVNIAPDHLDWHGSPQAYADAKRRIGKWQTHEDIITYDADDPGASRAVVGCRHARSRRAESARPWAAMARAAMSS